MHKPYGRLNLYRSFRMQQRGRIGESVRQSYISIPVIRLLHLMRRPQSPQSQYRQYRPRQLVTKPPQIWLYNRHFTRY